MIPSKQFYIKAILSEVYPLICRVEKHVGYATLDCPPGTNIQSAAETAIVASRYMDNVPVNFTFNNVLLTGKKEVKPETIVKRFINQNNQHSKIYKKSLEGKAEIARFKTDHINEVVFAQSKADAMIKTLPVALKEGEASTLKWVCEIDDALNQGAKFDEKTMKIVFQMLKSKGYVPNDALNLPKNEYNDKSVIARCIIGKFMNRPGDGHLKIFAGQYFKKYY